MANQYSLETIKAYIPLSAPMLWLIGEVERLEAEREAADSLIAKLYGENERLKAENEQLRLAIVRLRDMSRMHSLGDHPAVVRAEAALREGER